MTPGVRRVLASATAAWVLAAAPAAWAQSDGAQRVAIVKPASADATLVEAVHRIRGELGAEGFDVVEVDAPPPQPDAAPPATAPGEPPAPPTVATLALTLDEGARIAELRVFDRLTNKVVIRRTPIDETDTSSGAPRAAEVLAVRAVELLRASLLELLVEPRRSAPPLPAAAAPAPDARRAAQWAARALAPEHEPVWGFEAGAEVLGDFTRIPAALLATVRVRRVLAGPLGVRLRVSGLGTIPEVTSDVGSANVTQAYGLVELTLALGRASIIRPVASIGAGAAYVAVDGRSDAPYEGRHSDRWGFAADAGLGAELRLDRHVGISLEGHVLAIAPYPTVQFLGVDVAKTGVPALSGSVTVVGWL